MIIIFFEYIHDSLQAHLFNIVWETFTEFFEKVLRVYAWQQQN